MILNIYIGLLTFSFHFKVIYVLNTILLGFCAETDRLATMKKYCNKYCDTSLLTTLLMLSLATYGYLIKAT